MHSGKNFALFEALLRTKRAIYKFLIISTIPTVVYAVFGTTSIAIPWVAIALSILVSWVFPTMEKIGESTENPFQGGTDDISISSLARTIEIDLREMWGETELSDPVLPKNNILM